MTGTGGFSRVGFLMLVGTLLLLLLVPRCLWLAADIAEIQPGGWTRVYLTDEGRKVHNARNLVVHGRVVVDDFNQGYFTSPAYFAAVYPVFRLFGPGFIQARSVSVAFGLLTLLLFYSLLARPTGRGMALAGMVLLGLNFPYLMYNRFANMETMMIFFMCASGYFCVRGADRRVFNVLAGLLAVAAFMTKPTGLLIAAVAVLAYILKAWNDRDRALGGLLLFVAGLAMGFGIWALWLFFPGADNAGQMARVLGYSQPETMFDMACSQWPRLVLDWFVNMHFMWLFVHMPLVAVVAYASSVSIALATLTRTGKVGALEQFCLCWVVGGLAMSIVVPYHHVRYFLHMVPPMVVLAITFVGDAPRWVGVWTQNRVSALASGCALFPLLYFAVHPVSGWVASLAGWHVSASLLAACVTLVMGTVLTLALVAAAGRSTGGFTPRGGPLVYRVLVISLVGGSALIGLVKYAGWATCRTYDLDRVSDAICRAVGDDAVLLGAASQTLLIPSTARGITTHQKLSAADALERYSVTHLVVQPDFLPVYADLLSGIDGDPELDRAVYRIRGGELYLYSIAPGSLGPEP